jgi:hypothetical protein
MIADLISRLRRLAPTLGGRVMGAAEEEGALAQAVPQLPAAFVYPLEEKTEASAGDYHLCQTVLHRWAVLTVLDASADPLGYAAVRQAYETLQPELWHACLGWLADPQLEPVRYRGAVVVKRDAARLWVRFAFEVPRLLSEGDGRADPVPTDGGPEDADLGSFTTLLPVYSLRPGAAAEDLIDLEGNDGPL